MADKKLRQAIAYGMDIETVANEYYDGLRSRANSLIPPVFATYYDSSLKGYNYDPEKAKKLLDEAGYKDTNNDGFREDKNGKAFTIKLAGMSGSDKDNKIAQYYIQNWKDIGLKDNKDIDMFMAAWATGTNPSPIGLYSKYASFNYSRYTTPELEEQLNAIDSKEALDPDYRAQAFKKWQETMKEEAVTVPMYVRTEIIPVNKRVKKFSIDYVNGTELQDIELTADEPIKE